EFRIQTSSFAPEFGRTPGGQISIVTRAGTNAFHGALFEYFRNDALDAKDWFVNFNGLAKPAERQNDFGGRRGRPGSEEQDVFLLLLWGPAGAAAGDATERRAGRRFDAAGSGFDASLSERLSRRERRGIGRRARGIQCRLFESFVA